MTSKLLTENADINILGIQLTKNIKIWEYNWYECESFRVQLTLK